MHSHASPGVLNGHPLDSTDKSSLPISPTTCNEYAVHGTGIAVRTNYEPLGLLIDRYYSHFRRPNTGTDPLDISVNISWGGRFPHWQEAAHLGSEVMLSNLATQLTLTQALRVEFSASALDRPWTIDAYFREPSLRALARRLRHGPAAKRSNMLSALRYAVHYPLFLHQQTSRRRSALHAAVVQSEGRAVLFCGANGSGKSSLALMLVDLFGFKLLSDNFALTDGVDIYAFPEESRLCAEVLSQLRLGPPSMAKTHGKYHVNTSSLVGGLTATASLIVFPEIVPDSMNEPAQRIRPISEKRAKARLDALHVAVGESPEFSTYGLAIDSLFEENTLDVAPTVHTELAKHAPAVTLSVPRNPSRADYGKVLRQLIGHLV